MQDKKKQLEPDIEKQTGSNLERSMLKLYIGTLLVSLQRQNGCLRKPYTAMKRREVKGKGEKERYTNANAAFQRIARRDKKAFPSE